MVRDALLGSGLATALRVPGLGFWLGTLFVFNGFFLQEVNYRKIIVRIDQALCWRKPGGFWVEGRGCGDKGQT